MKFCTICGKQSKNGDSFCTKCGAPFSNSETIIKKKTAKKLWAPASIIGCALISLGIGCFTLFAGSDLHEDPEKLVEYWANAYVECDGHAILDCYPDEFVELACEEKGLSRSEFAHQLEKQLSRKKRSKKWELTDVVAFTNKELKQLEDELDEYDLDSFEEAYYYVIEFSDDDEWVQVVRIGSDWYICGY
ncbi:MAG: hypothetical protein IJW34_08155 [Clostridia bacterium]|nr:hypothetical protein [Clostridia bacterium]